MAFGCLGKPIEAESEIIRAMSLAKSAPLRQLIIHAIQRQPPSVIVADANAFLAKHGQEPYAYNQIGDLVLQLNMPTEAIPFYETALRLDPDDLATRVNLGGAYLAVGRTFDGFASYRKAIEINPHDERLFDVHTNLANNLRDLGRFEEAEAEYRAILASPLPTSFQRFGGNILSAPFDIDVHARARNGLVGVLREQKKFDAAMAEVNKNIDREPGNADVRIELAFIERDQGRVANATASFQRAIGLAPNSPAAYYFFGSFLRGQGKFDEAIKQLQRAIELTPVTQRRDVSNAYYEIGLAEFGQQKLDEAANSVKKAIDVSSSAPGNELNRSAFQLSLAQIYRAQEKNDDAAAALQEAVRLDPDAVEPYRQLAEVFLALKRPEEAITQRRIVVEKAQAEARALFELASTLQSNGNLEEAGQIFRNLYDQDPKSMDSIFNLASVTVEQARQSSSAERPMLLAQACKLVQDGLQSSPKDRDFISARERLNQLLPRRRHCTPRRSRRG
jgi:tetratricopeptide (TPR) repeat protein